MLKIIFSFFFMSAVVYGQNPADLFNDKCATCHVTAHPSTLDKSKLIAPPAFGVMKHVKEAFNGDKEQTIAFIKEYALNPTEANAKCRPDAIKRFGLMPSQKDLVTEEELSLIANYMFDTFGQGKTCNK